MKNARRLPRSTTSLSDLDELRRRLDGWRESQTGRARLPVEVWESAAALARSHGVSLVSRTLRLSFAKLQRCAQGPATPPLGGPAPAAFVELPPLAGPVLGGGACVVELRGGGGKMTLTFPSESPAVVALAEAFWRRGR